jgi:hypothetical protein
LMRRCTNVRGGGWGRSKRTLGHLKRAFVHRPILQGLELRRRLEVQVARALGGRRQADALTRQLAFACLRTLAAFNRIRHCIGQFPWQTLGERKEIRRRTRRRGRFPVACT